MRADVVLVFVQAAPGGCCPADTVLGTGETAVNKMDRSPAVKNFVRVRGEK